MENAVDIFRFEEHEVRTHIDEKGELWFVAKDVAEILEYKAWDSNLVGHIPVEWKGAKRIRTLGGSQEMTILSEQGLYFFLARSDKPKALPFQKWIAGEVLPSIRKTGSYSVKALTPAEMLLQQAQMLVAHEREIAVLAIEQERLSIEQEKQGILLADMRDGADFYAITAYHKVFLHKPISNEEAKKDGFRLSKICKAHGIQLGRSPHPTWGTVNTYPKAILDEYYVRGGALSEN